MSATAVNPLPPESEDTARAPVVLVVEDEVLIRFALADYMRGRGLRVHEAGTGIEAIQLLSFYKTEIDVVFSDVYMPGSVDGFDLTQWIEQNRPGLPVILASGEVDSTQVLSRGCGLFFSKPYDLNLVVAAIAATATARRRDRQES